MQDNTLSTDKATNHTCSDNNFKTLYNFITSAKPSCISPETIIPNLCRTVLHFTLSLIPTLHASRKPTWSVNANKIKHHNNSTSSVNTFHTRIDIFNDDHYTFHYDTCQEINDY